MKYKYTVPATSRYEMAYRRGILGNMKIDKARHFGVFTKTVGFVDTSKSISGNVFMRFKIVVLYIKCNEPFSEHFD